MTVGEGSFSSVYRVRQQALDRWVAIKILNERNGSRRTELLDEAKTQAKMSISCIPAVYDAFVWDQRVFIVMEWIKGASLQALLEKGIPQQENRDAMALAIVSVLSGLHKLGFAHRDVKPANILVTPDWGIYLVDFGFAKKIGEGIQSVTGAVKGTPAYMAPEIWQGDGHADLIKADMFALGKLLTELKPSPEYQGLIATLLSHNPAARPASATELRRDWESLPAPRKRPDWKPLVSGVASELLTRQLLNAAKQLLFVKREEEAYWLLAECLQEDPDAAEALVLMENMPVVTGRKTRRKWAAIAAATVLFAVGLSAAFHFGRQSERNNGLALHRDQAAKSFLLPSRKSGVPMGIAARFRDPDRRIGRLSAMVFLEGAEACDSVQMDGNPLGEAHGGAGVASPAGERSFTCLDRGGHILYRERMFLLPFQRKIVRLVRDPSPPEKG